MAEIKRTALFGKLNSLAYKAIEGATVFCKMRGNPYVELVHWVHQILQHAGLRSAPHHRQIWNRSIAARRRPDGGARQASARRDVNLGFLTASGRSGRARMGLRVAYCSMIRKSAPDIWSSEF